MLHSYARDDRKNRSDKGTAKKKDGPQKQQKDATSKKGICNVFGLFNQVFALSMAVLEVFLLDLYVVWHSVSVTPLVH